MFMYNKTAADVAYDIRSAVNEHSCGDTTTEAKTATDGFTSFTLNDRGHVFRVEVTKVKGPAE